MVAEGTSAWTTDPHVCRHRRPGPQGERVAAPAALCLCGLAWVTLVRLLLSCGLHGCALDDNMNDIPPYPLYNRTYNLFRLSPLHHGDAPLLADRTLRTHAKRLKEQLKGDNVRGVQVDFASAEDTARLGPLEECTWELLGDEDAWIDRHIQLQDSTLR